VAAPAPVAATQTTMRSPSSQAPASAAALRWLEGAFAGLRDELQAVRAHLNQQQATMAELVNGVTQQQALLSELLDARDADFRLAEAAESLPQFVSDAVAHEVRVNRERTVAAIASTLDAKLAEASLGDGSRAPSAKRTVAELRAFLENDPKTGSIVAAISTQAATQAMRTEMAEQLPKALNQALAGSDARMDELAERMDRLLTRAMRVGARAATGDTPVRAGGRSPAKATTTGPVPGPSKRSAAPRAAAPSRVAAKPAKSAKPVKPAKSAKPVKPAKAAKATRASRVQPKASAAPPAAKPPAKTTAAKARAATKAAKPNTATSRPATATRVRSAAIGKRAAAKRRTPKPV